MTTVTEPTEERRPPTADPSEGSGQSAADRPLRIRFRVRFAKTGLLRWISHRDLARLWERLLRRAHLKLSMTEGFHPKPRVSFPSALALGVESLDEVVEVELAQSITPRALFDLLVADDQPGLTINSVCRLPDQFGKAQLQRSDYVINVIDGADRVKVKQAIEQLLSQRQVSLQRKNKMLTIDLKDQIHRLDLIGDQLHLSLTASDKASLRPGDVLDLLNLGDWIEKGSLVTRVRVVLEREFQSDDPDLMAVSS